MTLVTQGSTNGTDMFFSKWALEKWWILAS
jgi:hypothetical protein